MIYFLLALVSAVAAAVLLFFYLEDIRARAVPLQPVLVAAQDLAPGDLLQSDMVTIVEFPLASLPAAALTDLADALGRSAHTRIDAGEVLLPYKIGAEEGSLSSQIPQGRWAMVLPSAWLASPFPAVECGDRIDIAAHLPGQERNEAVVIAAQVPVLERAENWSTVTLAVAEEEFRSIFYARSSGFALLALLRPQGE